MKDIETFRDDVILFFWKWFQPHIYNRYIYWLNTGMRRKYAVEKTISDFYT